MAIEHRYLEVDGLRTFYLTVGSGHPVVMIHGGAPGVCSLVAWKLNMEPLAASGLCLYAFDQAGFGNTDNPADYSMDYRVTHARKFIDALGLERFHLLGNSMGAYIAARIALEDPRAGRLVLISSGTLSPPGSAAAVAQGKKHNQELREYTPSLDNMRAVTLKTLFKSELVTDELVAERYEMSTGSRFDAIVKRWEAPSWKPVGERLSELRNRTLLIWGRNDRGVALERGVLLFEALPDAELHVFNHCGHWAFWDQAERFNRLVGDFLSQPD